MTGWLGGAYLWVKATHVIFVIFWMAGLFMMPRYLVYHQEALVAGDIVAFGRDRGRGLFEAAARVLGAGDRWLGEAGEGWALAELATTSPDSAAAKRARDLAEPLLSIRRPRVSREGRALAALALGARYDLEGRAEGSPARIARLLTLRLTGR